MELLKVHALEEARQKIIDCFPKAETEELVLESCLGRVLAGDIFANDDIPAFNRSTVDGYAVVARDTAAAGEGIPVILTLVGEIEMGHECNFSIKSGECAYVPTGGMLPGGADAVVMVEYSEEFGDSVALYSSVAHGAGVVRRGDDAQKSQLLLERGRRLRACEIGVLSAAGASQVPVYKSLRVAIVSTGDELILPDDELKPGLVYDINTLTLKAYAEKNGFAVVTTALLPDDESELEATIRAMMGHCDIIAVSGGSSRGKKDATAKVIARVADPGIFAHGLAVKPGKPTIIGYDMPTHTLFIGLPGHPVSAVIVFESLICEFYRRLTGAPRPPAIPAKLSANVPASPGKQTYYPVKLAWSEDESCYFAHPVFGKSGLITTLSSADGFFEIARGKEGLAAGDLVMTHLF